MNGIGGVINIRGIAVAGAGKATNGVKIGGAVAANDD